MMFTQQLLQNYSAKEIEKKSIATMHYEITFVAGTEPED